jgi:hypothetical protein
MSIKFSHTRPVTEMNANTHEAETPVNNIPQAALSQVKEFVATGACTQLSLKCSDGSSVQADPTHNCEFPKCPEVPRESNLTFECIFSVFIYHNFIIIHFYKSYTLRTTSS